ncbi:MAG: alpha/beta hydrolase [Bacteroidetes bacterium HGW-Bacteroidetes-1]|jgi:pimeloyl-ACP methyl ester carboxylesterase|nr:MAG: alpha/beta hydrolase [Bacteroidetes bacterium HGW-Bacteroidetes-1]
MNKNILTMNTIKTSKNRARYFLFNGFVLLITIAFYSQCKTADTNTMHKKSMNRYADLPAFKSFDEIPYPFEVKKIQIDAETRVAYVDEGTGKETIIFIHGLGSYLPAWKKNIDALKNNYRCIAIDLPGYGKSSKVPHSGSMTYYAKVISEFMEKMGLEQAYIAGHSMGGQIAMVMSLYHPEKVKGLILASPAGFESFSKGQKQWFRNVMTLDGVMKTTVDDIQNNLYYNFFRMPEDADFMITDRISMRPASDFEAYCYAVVQSVGGMVDEPVLPFLEKITHPTLIIFGENDNLIPNRFLNPGFTREIAEKGHSLIPGSKLVMLPKTGHFLQFESAEAFNEAIKSFIK